MISPLTWWTKRLPASCRDRRRTRLPFSPRRSLLGLEHLEDRSLLSAGAVDLSFGTNGVSPSDPNATARAVAVEGDGKIVMLAQTQAGYDLLRYNPDGSLDSTFGTYGKITATFGDGTEVVNLAILNDGRIVVGGEHFANQIPIPDVARFNDDGTPDSSFGTAGVAEIATDAMTVAGMAVSGSGLVVLTGTLDQSIAVVRLTASGDLDSSLGGSGTVTLNLGADSQSGGVALQSDSKIVVTGFGDGSLVLARFGSDGSLDATFGNGGIVSTALPQATYIGSRVAVDTITGQLVEIAESFTVQNSGEGWSYDQQALTLLRFNSDGSPDTGFGQDGQTTSLNSRYFSSLPPQISLNLALQDDGKILVAEGTSWSSVVTRYSADGSLDLSYGNGGSVSVSSVWWYTSLTTPALALEGDGKVVVASDSSTWVDGSYQTSAAVTRLEGDSDIRPQPFGSDESPRQYLIAQAIQQYSWDFGREFPFWYYYPIGIGAVQSTSTFAALSALNAVSPSTADAATSPSYSQTNTQVAGVDEGDTVKTDGRYLYLLSAGQLVILDAWPAENLQQLSETPIEGTPLVEYLDGDRLTVISQNYQYTPWLVEGDALVRPGFLGSWGQQTVTVTVFNVSDRTAPTIVQQTTLDGSYNNSRAIGTTVYVALDSSLYLPGPQYTIEPISGGDGFEEVYETEAEYVARMEALPLDSLLPHWTSSITDASGTHVSSGLLTAPGDIYQPGVAGDTNLLSLVALDISGGSSAPTGSVSFLTSWDATLYAAPDNFYLVTSRWSYVNNWTFIDQISLADGDVSLAATGRVPGTTLNQFSMGENGAYFDIATTSGWWRNASNNVYVLTADDHTLDVVGKIEGLAPGESIRSVLFLGDRGFVSTFEQTDPLFAIDLSDPTNPVVAGQLQVSGYTGYLQAIDATHLIGIGQDQGRFEISLFDVSDLNHPTLVSRYILGSDDWSWSSAVYDYHAITYYPQLQALALPVQGSREVAAPDGSGTWWVWQSDLLVFTIGPNGLLQLQGEVSDFSSINRSVFIGDMLYSISDTSVQVHALADLSTLVAQVPLPQPVYPPWWWHGIIPLDPLPVAILSIGTTVGNGTFSSIPKGISDPIASVLPAAPASQSGDGETSAPALPGPTAGSAPSADTLADSRLPAANLVQVQIIAQIPTLMQSRTVSSVPQGDFQSSGPASNLSSVPATSTTASSSSEALPLFPVRGSAGPGETPNLEFDPSDPAPGEEPASPTELFPAGKGHQDAEGVGGPFDVWALPWCQELPGAILSGFQERGKEDGQNCGEWNEEIAPLTALAAAALASFHNWRPRQNVERENLKDLEWSGLTPLWKI